jgi:hypothetical protein
MPLDGGMQDFEMEEEALKRSSATPSGNSGTAKSLPMMTMTAKKTCYDAWLLLVAGLSTAVVRISRIE